MPTVKSIKINDESPVSEAAGLSSPLPAYRICYFINKETGLNFKKATVSTNFQKQGSITLSGTFLHTSDDLSYRLLLIKNQQPGYYLLPSLKKIDYIICLTGINHEAEFWDAFIRDVKKVPYIHYIFALTSSHRKPLNLLNFERC